MIYYHSDELYHHGILGQRWGKRNGPPYPLSSSAKSSSEKRATKSSSAKSSSEKRAAKSSSGSKTEYGMDPMVAYMLFSAAYYASAFGILAGASAIYETVDRHKENKYTKALNKKREEAGLKKDEATGLYRKKSKKTSIEDDASKVNPRFDESKKKGDPKYTTNCMMCTSTYEMRRRGYEVEVQLRLRLSNLLGTISIIKIITL